MGHIVTLLQPRKIILKDGFNRADNALTMSKADTGQVYAPLASTWGINGNRAYNVSDVSGEITLIDSGKSDYNLHIVTNGQTTGATNQRLLNIIFRANDTLSYLMCRVVNGSVSLLKFASAAFTTLSSIAYTDTDNVDVRFAIRCVSNQVTIYVNGIPYINYTLTAGETVFSAYTKVGLRLTKVGAPTGTARADNLLVEAL